MNLTWDKLRKLWGKKKVKALKCNIHKKEVETKQIENARK